MKKYLLLAVVVALLAGSSYVAEKSFLASSAPTPAVGETATGESTEVKPQEIEVEPQSKPSVRTPQTKTTPSTTISVSETVQAPTPNMTLSVNGSSYATFAPIGSNVLDAMRTLASTSNFTFTGRDYPSLGFFVDSINGKKSEKRYSWILYINGTLSGTGASETHLNAGDAVEWRYEKNY